ncbi:MAG: metallophosphoesterase [Polyangiaceae bacterium]|nr:metallophosphoesterase [Polyangiaceae bacterium]
MSRGPEARTRLARQGSARRRWWAALAAIPLVGLLVQVPQAGAANEVHLVAAGDFGARAATDTVLTKMAQLAPDAALALGDLAYEDVPSESAWCSYVKARVGEGFPFELISGNHESLDVQDGHINDFSACLPNQVPGIVGTYGREYYMDLPQGTPLVRVINASPALTFEDGRWTYATGDAHYSWLSAAIDQSSPAGSRQGSTARPGEVAPSGCLRAEAESANMSLPYEFRQAIEVSSHWLLACPAWL